MAKIRLVLRDGQSPEYPGTNEAIKEIADLIAVHKNSSGPNVLQLNREEGPPDLISFSQILEAFPEYDSP